jgi:hypothetical protein
VNLSWHSFDLKSGRRGPEVRVAGYSPFGRHIGRPTEATVDVYCYDIETDPDAATLGIPTEAGIVPGWDSATLPGRVMLVALDDEEQPVWAGMVLRRRSDAGQVVTCDCATLEAYFDRRYVTDQIYTTSDQVSGIAKGLIDGIVPTGIGFTVDAPASNTLRDREYFGDEDKTLLSVLQELMGVIGGPEFTVDHEWTDATKTTLRSVVRVRNRIGMASALPTAAFEMPGSVTNLSYVEDYSTEHGANDVMATSSGEGEARPESDHQTAGDLLAGGWVKYEDRFTPSTSITSITTLNAHASQRLALMREGLAELTLESHLDTGPRLRWDFRLGDDVEAVLTCPRFPARYDLAGAIQPGFSALLRCWGWVVDHQGNRLLPTLRDA